MDFLMNFFESRVNSIGTIEDKEKMSKVISKWESLKTHTMQEGFAMASKEAVAEEAVTEQEEISLAAKEFMKELTEEIAKVSVKAKHGDKKSVQAKKELLQFRSKLQGKSDLEIVQMFNKKLQTV